MSGAPIMASIARATAGRAAKKRLRPGVLGVVLGIGERPAIVRDDAHDHARVVRVRVQHGVLFVEIAPPANHFRRRNPATQHWQVGARSGPEAAGSRRVAYGASAAERRRIVVGFESDQQTLTQFQHRAFDYRWLGQHHGDGLVMVQRGLVGVRQLTKGGSGAVQ
jgi:hypothetical protein